MTGVESSTPRRVVSSVRWALAHIPALLAIGRTTRPRFLAGVATAFASTGPRIRVALGVLSPMSWPNFYKKILVHEELSVSALALHGGWAHYLKTTLGLVLFSLAITVSRGCAKLAGISTTASRKEFISHGFLNLAQIFAGIVSVRSRIWNAT